MVKGMIASQLFLVPIKLFYWGIDPLGISMKFSLVYRHALYTVNLNDIELVKLDAAVIYAKTVIVY